MEPESSDGSDARWHYDSDGVLYDSDGVLYDSDARWHYDSDGVLYDSDARWQSPRRAARIGTVARRQSLVCFMTDVVAETRRLRRDGIAAQDGIGPSLVREIRASVLVMGASDGRGARRQSAEHFVADTVTDIIADIVTDIIADIVTDIVAKSTLAAKTRHWRQGRYGLNLGICAGLFRV